MNNRVTVWDPLVRLFHWLLVAAFAVAWLSAEEWQNVHELAGYTVMGLIVFRLLWGLVGSRYARFRQFVRPPATTIAYIKDLRRGRERRHLGHNPAGAAMIIALLGGLALLTTSGWLSTLELGHAVDWLEEIHELMANLLLTLVVLHVGGVLLASYRHRENLTRAMVNGKKRKPEQDDID